MLRVGQVLDGFLRGQVSVKEITIANLLKIYNNNYAVVQFRMTSSYIRHRKRTELNLT